MASKNNDKRDLRLSLAGLEEMKTHELAELLANFVLLLKRLPDVKFSELSHPPTSEQAHEQKTRPSEDLVNKASERVNGQSQPGWWVGKD